MIPVSIERKNVEIEKTLYRLSKEISESDLSNPLLIGIPRRGDLLTKRISKYLIEFGFKHDIDTVNYRPFRDDLDQELEKSNLNISPEDRNIVLIDDVIYTGRTLRASIEAVMHSGRPKSITLACLIDRGHRELPITPKFIGKNIPTNESEYVSVFLEEIDKEDRIEVS
ncbi:MAG: bifunctional pyr operon transcriptional regulator/uracil phosphoribosyltransferase PyrR [Candidatus Actinomarinales bacterium]|nr:MAG: bifunctional pyr operon transcriptional regulator/uracil phosphoribosyltransferase PyrR [Candidatus Actinomarinales bacterium]